MDLCSAGAVHLVLEGSAHDTFNDIVQLIALRYTRVMRYLRMFKPVRCTIPGDVPGRHASGLPLCSAYKIRRIRSQAGGAGPQCVFFEQQMSHTCIAGKMRIYSCSGMTVL